MKRRDILIAVGGGIAGGSVTGVIGSDDATPAPLPGNDTDDGTNETDDGSTETEAVIDPSITQTNSPVDAGSQLTVDYSVINTGGSLNNTTDVWMTVGQTEYDRDTDITVPSGGSTTGQLSYTPTTAGSYTVSVNTLDAGVSQSVIVESNIPDSQVLRTADNNTASGTADSGIVVNPNADLNGLKAEISSNTSGVTTAYIRDSADNTLGQTDISSLTAGETFRFDGVSMAAGSDYLLTLDAGGSSWNLGFYDSPSYPYTTDAFDVVRVRNLDDSESTDFFSGVNNIRNLDY